MTRVRLRRRDGGAAPVVPFPYRARIPGECLGSSEILGAVVAPKTARVTEGRDAAFGGDARSGQYHDIFGMFKKSSNCLKLLAVRVRHKVQWGQGRSAKRTRSHFRTVVYLRLLVRG